MLLALDADLVLQGPDGERTVPAQEGSKAPVSIFVEETGKTGFAFLTDLADPRKLAQVNPGDSVELMPERGTLSIAKAASLLGYEPRNPIEVGFGRYIEWYRELLPSAAYRA